ncbi:MAG TPA: hypothetical protein VGM44_10435, partial [Polyangiaceae bacterium]
MPVLINPVPPTMSAFNMSRPEHARAGFATGLPQSWNWFQVSRACENACHFVPFSGSRAFLRQGLRVVPDARFEYTTSNAVRRTRLVVSGDSMLSEGLWLSLLGTS